MAETLSNLVRASPLAGLALPGSNDQINISQHADDTMVVVTPDSDFDVLEDCLNCYRLGSGENSTLASPRGIVLGT